jgi:hypothetical protein
LKLAPVGEDVHVELHLVRVHRVRAAVGHLPDRPPRVPPSPILGHQPLVVLLGEPLHLVLIQPAHHVSTHREQRAPPASETQLDHRGAQQRLAVIGRPQRPLDLAASQDRDERPRHALPVVEDAASPPQ